jgi:hypothetical protein
MVVVSEYESDPRVRRQAEALAARGDEVTVVALSTPGRPAVDTLDGVRVVHLPTRKYRGGSVKAYLSLYGGFGARATAWLARRPRAFDLVQAHSMPEALVFAGAVQRLFRIPLLPLKLMEYATLGIPVVTFRNPVIERYFPADTVSYVDPASPENLRSAMLRLATDPDAALAQARRAGEVMRQRLRWSQQKLAYFEVIDRLATRRLSSRG